MNRSYFVPGNLSARFLCYYGHTGDLFVDETLYPQNIEYSLHRRLKAAGYERIVFYSYSRGAYFLDEGSQGLWHGRKEKKPSRDLFSGAPRLKGRVTPQAAPARQNQRPMSFHVDAAEMLRYAEKFLNDTTIRTAVVFPDGPGVLREFANLDQGKLLDSFFKEVTQSSVSQTDNTSTAIFVFDRSLSQVEELFTGQVKESLRNYLLTPGYAVRHYIGLPDKVEVRRLLNYLRLWGDGEKRLQVDCGQLAEISNLLARTMAANFVRKDEVRHYDPEQLDRWQLKDLLAFLTTRFLIPGRELSLQSCRNFCKGSSETPALERLEALVGMEPVKKAVRAFIKHAELQKEKPDQKVLSDQSRCSRLDRAPGPQKQEKINLHFVITGNHGTGKTTAAELISQILCEAGLLATGQTVKRTPGELLGSVVGESEHNLIRAVEEAMGGVLLIDEAYDLAKPEAAGIVTQLLTEMVNRKGSFSLILAGYRDRMEALYKTNEGLKSRFGSQVIHIDDYTVDELVEIFRRKAAAQRLSLSQELEALLPTFLHNWYYDKRRDDWANGREMETLLENMTKGKEHEGVLEVAMIPDEYVKYTAGKAGENAWAELNQMIGLKSVKETINDLVLCIEDGDDPGPLHFRFEGPPGVGKSTVAKKLGKIFQNIGVLNSGHTIEVKPNQMIAGYVGQTDEKARAVFETAVDGVLFIDEAYGLIPDSHNKNDFYGAVLEILMEYTDPGCKKNMCVICAGYRQELQELMKCNPGLSRRFSKTIRFESYSDQELLQILKLKMEDTRYTAADSYWTASFASIQANIKVIQSNFNGGGMERYLTASLTKARRRRRDIYGKEVPPEVKWLLTAEDALTPEELAEHLNAEET